MPFCALMLLRFGNGQEENKLKRKKVYVHTENRAEQLVKTASNKRNTYIYRFHGKETIGGKSCEYVEEIELIPGEDDVTEENIKALYAAEDSEVYYNFKVLRPQRTNEDKQRIVTWKEEYIRKFIAKNGYAPHPADVKAAVDEVFPQNWSVSLDVVSENNSLTVRSAWLTAAFSDTIKARTAG